jgi:hypothetical protein
MKRPIRFEHRHEALAPPEQFLRRVVLSLLVCVLFVLLSLAIGMAGFHWLEGLAWIDAFLNASMLLSGMGPVTTPLTDAGKLFAGSYAIYCGFAVLIGAAIILAPIVHRAMHRFHLPGDTD